jgi:inosine-uridine nucleoside N-ribohydrolase
MVLGAAPAPVLLDTDIGDDIDDIFALGLVLSSPELELRGVTTVFGDAHTRALIACRFLQAVGRSDIPVASATPPREKPTTEGQFAYGLRPGAHKQMVRESAVEFLYQKLKAHSGELTLLAVGPLTNVADLLRRHPDCKPWIKRLVLMGGSVRKGYSGGQPEPEWNIKCDIKSAREVFASGVPLVVAPLDATADLRLEPEPLRRLFGAETPLTKELRELYGLWGKKTPVLFDPMAVALCFTDEFCTMEDLALEVDGQGITRIVTGRPNARVAVTDRRDRFVAWFAERLRRFR